MTGVREDSLNLRAKGLKQPWSFSTISH